MFLLVPAHPGRPGQRAVKRLCVCVCCIIKKILHRHQCSLRGSSSLCGALSQRGLLLLLDQIKLANDLCRPDGRLKLIASAFNRQGQYASSPGHRTYCYAELAVSSLVMAITRTYCAYPRKDSQAELTWVAGQTRRWFASPETVTHPRTNLARC